jgi:Ca2+-binding RTX toxin-like protein
MPQTFMVGTQAELLQALSQASGGDTIALKAGNYGNVYLQNKTGSELTFDSAVTITSADPGNPAIFTSMDVRDATNLTFDGVVFDYRFTPGDEVFERPFNFSGCDNLTIRNSVIDGDMAHGVSATSDGFAYGIGLSIRFSDGVTIENTEISQFHRGVVVSESSDVIIRNNDVHSIRSDGMDFSEVKNVVIEANHIHDFAASYESGDHRDMIQFWTNGTESPSENIVIRGNVLDIGDGSWTQSIFMRNDLVDQGLAGSELFYRNVLIENNVITNAHLHGITVGETAGLIIRNNSVMHADGAADDGLDPSVEIPRISVAATSTGVIINNNLTSAISGWSNQAGWQVTGNGIVQDQSPLAAGYYGNVFLSSSLRPVNGQHAFILLPGSAFDLAGTGAGGSQPEAHEGLISAQFHVFGVAGDGATRVFDARFNLDIADGAIHEWNFGDGTIVTGAVVAHSFVGGGLQDVTLTLRRPDGSVIATSHLDVPVAGANVLALGSSGRFVTYENGVATPLPGLAAGTAAGVQLGKPGVTATISRDHVSDIARTDEVDITLTLRADTAGAAGEVARQHGSFVIAVTAAGELALTLSSATGPGMTLTTVGAKLANLASHQISISLVSGRAIITVDGVVKANAAFVGPLGWTGSHDLNFGNPWGGQNFNGDLLAFTIMTDASDYPATPQTEVLVGVDMRILSGGIGDDVYVLNSNNVIIRDLGGRDEVRSNGVSINLGAVAFADIEHATLTGTAAADLTGNAGANNLKGNAGANILDGGAGNDTLTGGDGDDTYIVDNGGDRILETGTGIDTVVTTSSYSLGRNLENAVLAETETAIQPAALTTTTTTAPRITSLTGNTLANHLTGNSAANLLNGGIGADTLQGGGGDDTYTVDNRGDVVIEAAQGGTDTVRSAVSYTLGADVEAGVLTGRAATLTGNALANQLTGNAANNILDGGAGADTMKGGYGSDTYIVDDLGDVVIEGGRGTDTVLASVNHTLATGVENGVLTGGAVSLTGNGAANRLTGNAAANILDGRAGADWMTGGMGADTFVFATGSGRDRITDFDTIGNGHDVVDLQGLLNIAGLDDLWANHLRQVGADVLVISDRADVLRLQNVTLADLDARHFLI